MSKRSIVILLVTAILTGVWWGADAIDARSYDIAVTEPAPMYSLPLHEHPRTNPVAETLQPGQALRVIRHRYGKDFQTLCVETLDGHVGWVIGGEGIAVRRREWFHDS